MSATIGKANGDNSGKRLNIVLPERTMERINNLKDLTSASSVTDVIRTAILTYEALVEFVSDGNKFYLRREGGGAFVPVEFLFDVKHNSRIDAIETAQPEMLRTPQAEQLSSS